MMSSNEFSAATKRSWRARLASKLRGQPATMPMMKGSGSRLMRAATFSPATRFSPAIFSPTVADRPGMVRPRQEPARRPRRGVPVADVLGHRQVRFLAGERLAQDVGEKAGRGLVRRAGSDADRRQADGNAV